MYLDNGSITCSPDRQHAFKIPQGTSHIPRASRTCPCLVVPSGSVKLTISLNLGYLTWLARQQLGSTVDTKDVTPTFSRMTRGPLTPPTVLYLR